MKKLRLVYAALLLALSAHSFGYGVGWSSYPIQLKSQNLAAEFTGILNNGSGVGLQARYTQKLSQQFIVDAGAGIAAGQRSNRFFGGVDYEIFPDIDTQPRFSVRGEVERASEFERGILVLGVAPMISKGFSFWGKEGYPYLSVPMGLGLDTTTSSYHTRLMGALGITGPVPLEGYEKLMAKVEANINIRNTYSGIFLGVSYPLD